MTHYEKMLQLFELVKNELEPADLQYILTLIQDYDTCRSTQEAEGIEQTIIGVCEKQIEKAHSK